MDTHVGIHIDNYPSGDALSDDHSDQYASVDDHSDCLVDAVDTIDTQRDAVAQCHVQRNEHSHWFVDLDSEFDCYRDTARSDPAAYADGVCCFADGDGDRASDTNGYGWPIAHAHEYGRCDGDANANAECGGDVYIHGRPDVDGKSDAADIDRDGCRDRNRDRHDDAQPVEYLHRLRHLDDYADIDADAHLLGDGKCDTDDVVAPDFHAEREPDGFFLGHADLDCLPNANDNPERDAEPNGDGYVDIDPIEDCNGHADRYAHGYGDRDSDTDIDDHCDDHADLVIDRDADGDANIDADADAHGDAVGHGNTHPDNDGIPDTNTDDPRSNHPGIPGFAWLRRLCVLL